MSNVTVCVRFRPLSHKERKANGDNVCFKRLDSESFVLKVWTLFSLLLPLATWQLSRSILLNWLTVIVTAVLNINLFKHRPAQS